MSKILSNTVRFSIADSDFYFKKIMIKTLMENPFYMLLNDCNNGHELVNRIYRRQEDVFIIELFMPVLSGIEAINISGKTIMKPLLLLIPALTRKIWPKSFQRSLIYITARKTVISLKILLKEKLLLKNLIMRPIQRMGTAASCWYRNIWTGRRKDRKSFLRRKFSL
jgi:hypothetical protein